MDNSSHQQVSPHSKLRQSLNETISASKLFRDLSPTRLYSSEQIEGNIGLPDLFKQKCGLQSLRPTYQSVDSLLLSKSEPSRVPKLLQRLEGLLDEKLSLIDRLGSGSKGFAAAQLRTDAYRQVFDAFLHSFTTYRSLLLRVKQEYDVALDDALASLYDNVHMKAELEVRQERMEAALHEARLKAVEDATSVKKELEDQLQTFENRAIDAEKSCHAVELEIQKCRLAVSELRAEAAKLKNENNELKLRLLEDSSWGNNEQLRSAAHNASYGR
mmetsp:Transcript_2185/g.3296  ORF Transcript_2185/g.3296 Transcript_2185/m.3296 type:complete len:272 (-) Transcript_2185:298-1113(-)|eukprot:CAMPEP_0175067154 /NCGR_PEP_ID=MMETSP0052_2-20121109/16930_1 /TAXON_ID=51329 ORGANISM="Polytomella parva, Strain SAG 63-3" /NCGR_SAMPLE_ID=MMETSP0052_2 /ASSEMBLY_ACC=CAM_ASM_000194 /LENGTH=271 /DNA_ID=CAMNT_0016333983 /DNA_START=42 /DNA_END=857 /DNA_ORIENTATION=-